MAEKPEIPDLEPVDSPCQLVCSIDKESNMCFGCGRTPEEIAYWTLESRKTNVTGFYQNCQPACRLCGSNWPSGVNGGVSISADPARLPNSPVFGRQPIPKTQNVGFLLTPQFSMIAFTSAIEPLRAANRIARQTLFTWQLFSIDGESGSRQQ